MNDKILIITNDNIDAVSGILSREHSDNIQRENRFSLAVVGENGMPVSAAVCRMYNEDPNGVKKAKIEWIETVCEHRKKGYGRKLLTAVENEAGKRGADIIYFENHIGKMSECKVFFEHSGYELSVTEGQILELTINDLKSIPLFNKKMPDKKGICSIDTLSDRSFFVGFMNCVLNRDGGIAEDAAYRT